MASIVFSICQVVSYTITSIKVMFCRYRVFLGHKQYFVSSDVGAGKMQWYAFHKEPPGGTDAPNGIYQDALRLFWIYAIMHTNSPRICKWV